ncbi:uncharacterized protein [Amphiura filiformis]|uniref:uncharacterized protein n=1 Tax=Amphiura filiformis TaxID=82378 RepID=UPI003B2285CA
MYAKGKKGKDKRYYTGKRSKSKKMKLDHGVEFTKGEVVVYESGSKIYKGIIDGRSIEVEGSFVVKPEIESVRRDIVPESCNIKRLKELCLEENEYVKGMTVLVTWEEAEGGFIMLVPALVVEVSSSYCWVKSGGGVTREGSMQKVNKDEMCKIISEDQVMKDDENMNTEQYDIEQNNINVVRLVLHTTQEQLCQLTETYNRTKEKLAAATTNACQLAEQNVELNNILIAAVGKIKSLEEELSKAVTKTQADKTLYALIATQRDNLDYQSKRIVALEKKILDLRREHQLQKGAMSKQLQELEDENRQLRDSLNELSRQKDTWLQSKPSSKPGVLQTRDINMKKYASYIQVESVKKASSNVNEKILKKRADKLNEVLNVISSPSTTPDTIDIITTLAAYLKRHPEIALPACQAANISFMRELSVKECVDLKLLLKLPMTKLKDLRRFLSNHNIRFMPSDQHLYKEMRCKS